MIAPTLRDTLRSVLLEAFTDSLIAEWVCCDPPRKGHKLCKRGHAAIGMIRAAVDDDPDTWPSRSQVLDALELAIRDYAHEQVIDPIRARLIASLDQVRNVYPGSIRILNVENVLVETLAELDRVSADGTW